MTTGTRSAKPAGRPLLENAYVVKNTNAYVVGARQYIFTVQIASLAVVLIAASAIACESPMPSLGELPLPSSSIITRVLGVARPRAVWVHKRRCEAGPALIMLRTKVLCSTRQLAM